METLTDKQYKQLYHAALLCHVLSIQYDFVTHTGKLMMPEMDCPGMTEAIRYFQQIDPRVQLIETYSGDKPDTFYRKVDHEWQVICH